MNSKVHQNTFQHPQKPTSTPTSLKPSMLSLQVPFRIPLIGNHWLLCRILVCTVAFLCYMNSSGGDFVFDDSEAIIGNKDIDPVTPLTEVFTDDFWGKKITDKTSHKSYRPLTVLTFRWNYWLAGGRVPFGFHFTNVFLHAIASVMFLEVCCCLLGDWPWRRRTETKHVSPCTLFASVLFALHPIHSESVAGVVGRAELTSALCFFGAFLTYAQCCKTDSCISLLWLLLTVLLGSTAMLFKEQGLSVMGVCVAYDVVVHMKIDLYKRTASRWQGFLVRISVVVLSTVLLLWARIQLMDTGPPQFQAVDNPASFAESLLARVLSYNYIYALNAWLLLSPWWLCFDWSMGCVQLVESLADPRLMSVMAFWVTFGALGVYVLLGKPTEFKRLVAMSVVLLVVPFIPASNLFFRVGFVVAERVLYLPSAGYCLLVALGTSTLARYRWRKLLLLSMVTLVLLFFIRSAQRSSEWLTEESLFTSGAKVCPHNAKVFYNIGKVRADSGQTEKGEIAYREAIRLHPEYDQALNNLGNLLKETSRSHEAEEMFHRALKANPEFAAAWMNLGIVQAALNQSKEAEQSYKTAIQHRKKYPDAYYNLGNLYLETGRHNDAIAAFKSAIALQKDHINSWNNLGLLYEDMKMYKEAEAAMMEAIRIMPDQPQFYYTLGVMLGRLQRLEEGEKMLLKAISLSPATANYHANLGVIYHLKKQYNMAEEHYRYALSLEPSLMTAKDNLHKLQMTRRKHSI